MVSENWKCAVLPALLFLGLVASAEAQTPEETFDRGNAAYEQGRYEEAAQAYRSLLRYQIGDAIVEYNLANAEFRLGHLGPAILHFERARRLDPLDPDIRANLEYARSLCFDRVEPQPQATLMRWIHLGQNRLGPDRQAWILLVAVWLIAGLLAWCFSRPGGWSPAYGWVLAGLLLVVVLAGSSWQATLQRLETGRTAVVLDEVAEVLAGPGFNNPALFTVHEGLTLQIRSERQEWLQVSLPNGLNGWISREAVGQV